MAPRKLNSLDRFLLRLLGRTRGPGGAVRDLHYMQEIFRFSISFTLLVIAPLGLLTTLALESIETETVANEVSRNERAKRIASRVQLELVETFERFELRLSPSLVANTVDINRLLDEVPALRGAYAFDADGVMVAPFTNPVELPVEDTLPMAWRKAMDRGLSLATRDNIPAAIDAYGDASTSTDVPSLVAEALLMRGQLLLQQNERAGLVVLDRLAQDRTSPRERRGFVVADLAALTYGLHLASKTGTPRVEGLAILERLVKDIHKRTWPSGLPNDGFVQRRALEVISPSLDPALRRLYETDLRRRLSLQFWSSTVFDELDRIRNRPVTAGSFTYVDEPKSLWVLGRAADTLWAFGFDHDALTKQLGRSIVETANEIDPDLTAALASSDAPFADVLARQSLAPILPELFVLVRPADPTALAQDRRRQRFARQFITLMAFIAAGLGALLAARLVLRELDEARQKADFAAIVSHELRSPITQIRLKGEALQLDLTVDDQDRQAHYDAIVAQAERLSRLVDNVLDFASIERGSKTYAIKSVALKPLLTLTARTMADEAKAAGAPLRVNVPDGLPRVMCDRDAITQVVLNLISNAIKYGASGGVITLEAELAPKGVRVAVADNGQGIPKESQDRIFEHYYRVASTSVRKKRGTGIGLTIVRYIVEAHGGNIGVISSPGEGATFHFTLPLETPRGQGA
ncbi:MAG: sensor histidine kinase [Myxococcota bacterium]